MNAAKLALLGAWLLCASGFFLAPAAAGSLWMTAASWARYAFWLMLAAHAVEFALFLPRLRKAPGALGGHFLNTLVFGVLHIRGLPPLSEAA